MRLICPLAAAFLALSAGAAPVWAFPAPETNVAAPTRHQTDLRNTDKQAAQPYAMRYTDEAAQTLGMKDGKWEAFVPVNPLLPRINGGLDGGRPMVHLQWRPEQ
jgi:hypothetical protein